MQLKGAYYDSAYTYIYTIYADKSFKDLRREPLPKWKA